jgi:serine/threonine protein kinase
MSEEKDKIKKKSENSNQTSFLGFSQIDPVEKIGTFIGPYKLLSVLGEGGFGIVYLAEQKEPVRRQVALKIVKPGMDSKQIINRFEAERQALALLDHPNIAYVFDGGITNSGRPYFVMEFVKGLSITEYCDQHKLSIERRLELFKQVCEAIQHAHQKGIIHRDIKPSNILVSLLDNKPIPKIIDFGFAKAINQPLTEQTLFTEQGQFIGTLGYMSPEQVNLTREDIDTRSDIYSLGVLLYELLIGVPPFDPKTLREASFEQLLKHVREDDPPKPSTRLSSLGVKAQKIAEERSTQIAFLTKRMQRELEWIPLMAMRKERERRYRTASELADDIDNYLNGNPLKAGPESARYILKKFVRRHRYTSTVAALLLLIILSFSCIGIYLLVKTREAQKDFNSIRSEWSEVSGNMFRLYRQVGFMQFLELWQEGKDADAELIAGFLSDGSKEKKGAMYLLDPQAITEKQENLRKNFSKETQWFADFLIAEQQLKSGYQQDALEAYNRSYKSIQLLSQQKRSFLDTLLVRHIMSRLYTLDHLNKAAKDGSSIEGSD